MTLSEKETPVERIEPAVMTANERENAEKHDVHTSKNAAVGEGPPILGYLIIAGGFVLLWAWHVKSLRTLLYQQWPMIVAAVFLLLCLGLTFGSVRRRLKKARTATQVSLVMVLLALLSAAVIGGVVLPTQSQNAAFKCVFLLIACLFPPILYYLFISTRKYSLLYEFILNLDRLGLLRKRQLAPHCTKQNGECELDSSLRLRIRAYLERFEAVYGSLGSLVNELVEAKDPRELIANEQRSAEMANLASVFNQGSTAPLIISTVLIALGWVLVMPPLTVPSSAVQNQVQPVGISLFATPIYYAFLGAYFFAAQMLFRRYIRKDLRGSAYTSVSMRILLAVIGTWVIMQLRSLIGANGDSQIAALAFAIGFFPPVAWRLVRQALKGISGLLLPALDSQLPLSDLDGLNIWHQTRLEEEDIESTPSMATADIVDLLLNTRIPPDRIIDWVDQAILYTQLPEEKSSGYRKQLRKHGIRTASQFLYAYDRSNCQEDTSSFEAILSAEHGQRSPVRGLAMTLFTNPNLCLIQSWRGLTMLAGQVASLSAQDSRDNSADPHSHLSNGKAHPANASIARPQLANAT